MNNQIPRNETIVPPLRTRGRSLILAGAAAAIVSALSIVGVSHAQDKSAPQATQHERHAGHGKMNPERAEKRIERTVDRLLADGTPEQKAKVVAIAKAAFNDLRPLREKSRAARAQGIKLLAQPTVDRAALEQVRQTQQQLADQRSRRITQALADAAEVLTPAQRVKVAEQLGKRGHRFGHGHHHGPKHGHGPEAKE